MDRMGMILGWVGGWMDSDLRQNDEDKLNRLTGKLNQLIGSAVGAELALTPGGLAFTLVSRSRICQNALINPKSDAAPECTAFAPVLVLRMAARCCVGDGSRAAGG